MVRFLHKFLLFSFIVLSINVKGQLNADFSASQIMGCSPLVVNFTDLSTGNPTAWQWNFGNGNTSNVQNPMAVFVAPGTYTITLIASNANGSNTEIKTAYINVILPPQVQFSYNIISTLCGTQNVQFNDQSVSATTITDWFWSFGDGATSTLQNPTHLYSSPGTYSVSLVVSDINGCSNTFSQNNIVTVTNQVVSAGFTSSSPTSCTSPHTVNFTNQSTGTGLSYLWNFGDGTTSTQANPSHQYNGLGNYTVTLTVSNSQGCTNTITQSNYVQLANSFTPSFTSVTTGCVGQAITFTNTSTPTPQTSTWNFGDGTSSTQINPIKIYTAPGTYSVSLNASAGGGCQGNVTLNNYITIHPKPVAAYTAANTFYCQVPASVPFTNLSTGATSYSWNFGNSTGSTQLNPTATYQNPGTYNVRLIATNQFGCKDTMLNLAYITVESPQLTVNASVTNGCLPLTVNFTSNTVFSQPITSWNWDFGNGQTSTLQNPTITFNQIGSFPVTLTVSSASGCSATQTLASNINVAVPPVAAYTQNFNTVCASQQVQFTNQSQNADTYLWDFGNTVTTTQFSPANSWSNDTTYTITLTASNACGTSTSTSQVTVLLPVSDFTFNQDCGNLVNATFTDQSQGADTWSWNFGDGTILNYNTYQPTISHTYASNGNYTVTLTVTNLTTGCTHSRTKNISAPVQSLNFIGNPTSGCAPLSVQFTNQSSGYLNYRWLFSDGTEIYANNLNSPNVNPTKIFNIPDVYTVSLVGTRLINGVLCSDTIVFPNYINVFANPTTQFSINNITGCSPTNVSFTNTSQNANSFLWDFGDGSTSNLTNPTHGYSNVQNVVITLTAFSNQNCFSTDSINISFPPPPTIDFSTNINSTCVNSSVTFNPFFTGNITNFSWNFGDGGLSSQSNPSHSFADTGSYNVTLTVTDSMGCIASVSHSNLFSIIGPTASFTSTAPVGNCPPLVVNYTNTSSSDVVSWSWNLGSGMQSTLPNPTGTYLYPGTFDVFLVVTDAAGCTDTAYSSALINLAGPQLSSFNISDVTLCPSQQANFNLISPNADSYFTDFGDGTPFTSLTSFSHAYPNEGTYYPLVVLSSNQGGFNCVVTYPLTPIQVQNITVNAGLDQNICPGQVANLSGSGAVNYSWTPAVSLSNPNVPNPTSNPATTTQYILTGTTPDGCINYDTVQVIVEPVPSVSFINQNVCLGTPVTFNNTSTINSGLITSYNWDFGNGTYSNQTSPTVSYNNFGNYTVTLSATSNMGCQSSYSSNVIIYRLPIASFEVSKICVNEPSEFINNSLIFNGQGAYQWTITGTGANAGYGPFVFNQNNLNTTFSSSGTYTILLQVMDSAMCLHSVQQEINIQPVIANAGVDDSVCIGSQTQLFAANLPGYSFTWSPSVGLSNPYSWNPVCDVATTTTYTLTAQNAMGCSASDQITVYVFPIPQAGFMVNPTELSIYNPVANFLNTSIGAVNYIWDFDDGSGSNLQNPSHSFNKPGYYDVHLFAINESGCVSDTTQRIYVEGDFSLYVPSAFTPSNDGLNEVFFVKGVGIDTKDFSLRIYSRWGDLVYYSTDINQGWDGTFHNNGTLMKSDIYVYKISLKNYLGKIKEFEGSVNLLR